jgi:hypothetical protein
VLRQEAPAAVRRQFGPGYLELLADLGIRSAADLGQRIGRVRERLPQVWELAESVMAANPAIAD